MKFLIILIAVTLMQAPVASAQNLRELKINEVQYLIDSRQSLGLAELVEGLGVGEIVDVRGFLADALLYQITILRPDGTIVTAIVNGQTGVAVPRDSAIARLINEVASKTVSPATSVITSMQPDVPGNANVNSNAGGNTNNGGNGNSGGNGNNGNNGGNGNSGGNGNNGGNGNSGGNGKNK